MELGRLPAADGKRRRHLSGLDVRRPQNDHHAVVDRMGSGAAARRRDRCPAHGAEQGAVRLRHRLGRAVHNAKTQQLLASSIAVSNCQ